MQSVLFVCLGNICRSPLAEAIFRNKAEAAGLNLRIDSAGTGDWHAGERADPRAIRVGEALGYPMPMRSRQVTSKDFSDFDLIVAMDRSNVDSLVRWPGSRPEKVALLRSFDPLADRLDVPDPYYGSIADFEETAELIDRACDGLLAVVLSKA